MAGLIKGSLLAQVDQNRAGVVFLESVGDTMLLETDERRDRQTGEVFESDFFRRIVGKNGEIKAFASPRGDILHIC